MSKRASRRRRKSKQTSTQKSPQSPSHSAQSPSQSSVSQMTSELSDESSEVIAGSLMEETRSERLVHRTRPALVTSKVLSVSQTVKRIKQVTQVDRDQFFGVWDYVIIVLSLASLVTMFMQLNRGITPELAKLLNLFDLITCAIFFVDFLIRLSLAPSKLQYLRWGWIDLISSIPTLEQLRFGRIFRLIRILRAVKGAVASTRQIKLRDPFLSAVMIYFLCVFLGATSVLYLEAEVEGSNIRSARDAIWWAMVTVTTVGYGDFTPVTDEGRLLAVTLMSAGIGLFGVFSVQCTQYLLKRWQDDESDKLEEIHTELGVVKAELSSVHHKLNTLTELISRQHQDIYEAQDAQAELTFSPLPKDLEGDHRDDG